MKIKKINQKKINKFKFDFSNFKLKFAFIVLLAVYLHDFFHYKSYSHKSSSLEKKGIYLAVGVVSASSNRIHREVIREGWGRSPDIYHLNFFIATNKDWNVVQKVQAEGDRFKDIVLVQAAESYYNITHQTLEIFKTLTVDPRVTHVMKVDDDSYVRMELLSTFLIGNEESFKGKESFAGYLEPVSGPIRDVNSKWYMSPSDWPYDYYPTWAHGAGYILSENLARSIGNGGAALRAVTPIRMVPM